MCLKSRDYHCKFFADCLALLPFTVNSASAMCNLSGLFRGAKKNGTLFYSSGTQPTLTQTTCLATAKWRVEKNLECFKGCDCLTSSGKYKK